MGILDKIVTTVATNSIIKTAGNVATSAANTILSEVNRHKQENMHVENNHIKVPDVTSYSRQHYLKVRASLIALGFTDITYITIKDLTKGWLTKDGEVQEVSINGKTSFNKREKVSLNSPVVIVYHTFKDGYGNSNGNQLDNINLYTSADKSDIGNKEYAFCSQCGQKHSLNDKFCVNCGNKLK